MKFPWIVAALTGVLCTSFFLWAADFDPAFLTMWPWGETILVLAPVAGIAAARLRRDG